MLASRTTIAALTILLLSSMAAAQSVQQPRLDLAATYVAEGSLRSNTGQNFWLQGGALELGANVFHGFGLAANVTGTHASSIGASGIPLSLVTATFGPRYRWHAERKLSAYGEVLIGEANGFHSLDPTPSGAQSNANGLALQFGGGVDYRLKSCLAIRLIDAAWARTQIPNATNNLQNNLQLGAGIVLRFGR